MKQIVVKALLAFCIVCFFLVTNAAEPVAEKKGAKNHNKTASSEESLLSNRKLITLSLNDGNEITGYVNFMDADQLPAAENGLFQKKYKGYNISGKVVEVIFKDFSAYIVTIENEKEILTIRLEGKSSSVISRLEKM
ncbi:MAG: hypothetical protein HYX40_10655 [Sphingobacteriales bacterium]|nr:hypothetical protein [Sphingobacteriales bacterium]